MNSKTLKSRIKRYLLAENDAVLGLYTKGVKPSIVLIHNADAGDLDHVQVIDSKLATEQCYCGERYSEYCADCEHSVQLLLFSCQRALSGKDWRVETEYDGNIRNTQDAGSIHSIH